MTFTLQATARTLRGKQTKALRTSGQLPAVIYGPKEPSTAISIDRIAFEKLFKETGESSIITITGIGGNKDVLVHDVSFDARRGGVIHVDFYAIEAGKELEVEVPLHFVGEAPAIKLGGTLTKVLHEVEVVCEPSKLPKEIIVDVVSLDTLDAQIHVSDLVVPAGVTIKNDPEEVVALVQAVEEEVVVAQEVDMAAIEVEKKGKTETEA